MGEADGICVIFACKLGKVTDGICEFIAPTGASSPEATVKDKNRGGICLYIFLQNILFSPIFHLKRDLDGSGGDIVGVYERGGCI